MRFFLTCAAVALATPAYSFDPSTQDDSVALARHFVEREEPVGPPIGPGSFEAKEGETISLMGGADVFRMQDHGFLESRLQAAFADRDLRVRNLGWSADTVHRQQRPMYFYTEKGDTREGSVPDQRERIEPGVLVLCFGRMESLAGIDHLSGFESDYEDLVRALSRYSKRIVIVAPVPFPGAGPAASLAAERNEVLGAYTTRIASLADRNGAVFVPMEPLSEGSFLSNGLLLSEAGHREFAARIGAALGAEAEPGEALLAAIRAKNRLWDQYYRPTNWAFLFGDRQHVPSSRDHEDSKRRWFVEELQRIPALIAEKEAEIHALVKGGAR